jgi:acyl carrier protein
MEQAMQLSKVLSAMQALDIETDGLSSESRLGDDAGMDSQEIVELHELLATELKIRLPTNCLKKSSTLGDVVKLLGELATSHSSPREEGGFAFRCETSEVFERNVDVVYNALFAMEEWDKLLPHVKAIETLYNDGKYQEFRMTVESAKGDIKVRSVRRCEASTAIDFFQPDPPAYLKHHAGGWRLTPIGDQRCNVVTFHHWNINDAVATDVFHDAPSGYAEQIAEILLGHARYALKCWKQILETGTVLKQLRTGT